MGWLLIGPFKGPIGLLLTPCGDSYRRLYALVSERRRERQRERDAGERGNRKSDPATWGVATSNT